MSFPDFGFLPEQVNTTLAAFAQQGYFFQLLAGHGSGDENLYFLALAAGLVGAVLILLNKGFHKLSVIGPWLLILVVTLLSPYASGILFHQFDDTLLASPISNQTGVIYSADLQPMVDQEGTPPNAALNTQVRNAETGEEEARTFRDTVESVNQSGSGTAQVIGFMPQIVAIDLINRVHRAVYTALFVPDSSGGQPRIRNFFASLSGLADFGNDGDLTFQRQHDLARLVFTYRSLCDEPVSSLLDNSVSNLNRLHQKLFTYDQVARTGRDYLAKVKNEQLKGTIANSSNIRYFRPLAVPLDTGMLAEADLGVLDRHWHWENPSFAAVEISTSQVGDVVSLFNSDYHTVLTRTGGVGGWGIFGGDKSEETVLRELLEDESTEVQDKLQKHTAVMLGHPGQISAPPRGNIIGNVLWTASTLGLGNIFRNSSGVVGTSYSHQAQTVTPGVIADRGVALIEVPTGDSPFWTSVASSAGRGFIRFEPSYTLQTCRQLHQVTRASIVAVGETAILNHEGMVVLQNGSMDGDVAARIELPGTEHARTARTAIANAAQDHYFKAEAHRRYPAAPSAEEAVRMHFYNELVRVGLVTMDQLALVPADHGRAALDDSMNASRGDLVGQTLGDIDAVQGLITWVAEISVVVGRWFDGAGLMVYITFMDKMILFALGFVIILTPFLMLMGLLIPGYAMGVLMTAVLVPLVINTIPLAYTLVTAFSMVFYEIMQATGSDIATDAFFVAVVSAGYTASAAIAVFLLFGVGNPQAIIQRIAQMDEAPKRVADEAERNAKIAAISGVTVLATGGMGGVAGALGAKAVGGRMMAIAAKTAKTQTAEVFSSVGGGAFKPIAEVANAGFEGYSQGKEIAEEENKRGEEFDAAKARDWESATVDSADVQSYYKRKFDAEFDSLDAAGTVGDLDLQAEIRAEVIAEYDKNNPDATTEERESAIEQGVLERRKQAFFNGKYGELSEQQKYQTYESLRRFKEHEQGNYPEGESRTAAQDAFVGSDTAIAGSEAAARKMHHDNYDKDHDRKKRTRVNWNDEVVKAGNVAKRHEKYGNLMMQGAMGHMYMQSIQGKQSIQALFQDRQVKEMADKIGKSVWKDHGMGHSVGGFSVQDSVTGERKMFDGGHDMMFSHIRKGLMKQGMSQSEASVKAAQLHSEFAIELKRLKTAGKYNGQGFQNEAKQIGAADSKGNAKFSYGVKYDTAMKDLSTASANFKEALSMFEAGANLTGSTGVVHFNDDQTANRKVR